MASVSHETIYCAVYAMPRDTLRTELVKLLRKSRSELETPCWRTSRAMRLWIKQLRAAYRRTPLNAPVQFSPTSPLLGNVPVNVPVDTFKLME